jgi:hypothetical protein
LYSKNVKVSLNLVQINKNKGKAPLDKARATAEGKTETVLDPVL